MLDDGAACLPARRERHSSDLSPKLSDPQIDMSESDRGNPIQAAVVVLLLVGGGWYFLRHYEIEGLDEVSINAKAETDEASTFIAYQEQPIIPGPSTRPVGGAAATETENPFTLTRSVPPSNSSGLDLKRRRPANLKVASWALDGFGPTKLANPVAQQNVARVVRRFDIVALQQIASIERDLVSRLVDIINHGETRYDYVLSKSTGPAERPEQLAFIFDTTRVRVDRQQTYTVQDPANQITFDPLVAWFRAAEPPANLAWTFSLVNLRIDLARAPGEVALLKEMMTAIRNDGRGEDDVVFAGLFQADDAYLIPSLGGEKIHAAVSNRPTDIFGKYQTSNLLVDTALTSEFVGRGGVLDYARVYKLTAAEAESVSSQLPVYAEFSAIEGAHVEQW